MLDCLERVKETQTQVSLSKEDRAEKIRDAFARKPAFLEKVKDCKQVCLVNAVAPSGATFLEATKVLKKAGVKSVWGLTLAHGE